MLRVLHIVQSLDPRWGGIARVVPELAEGLARIGVASRIATLAGGRYGEPVAAATVDVLRFSAPDRSALGRSREFDGAIDRLVREADVVHLHGLWTGQNWSAGAAARRLGRPYVVTPHSMMMPWAWRRSRWKKRLAGWVFEHRNLRGAACLHALAPGEADAMGALGFNPRIEVIANGLWPDRYASLPPPDGFLRRYPHLAEKRWLLFLGRVAVQKGIVPLLQAGFDLASRTDEWHFVIAGPDSGGFQRVLAAAINRKGMGGQVTFAGMLGRDEVHAVLGRAELLVQPSLSEGLSMSILEALAAGVPVLVSPACNLPEVEAGGAGRVVVPERREIAAALRALTGLSREALRQMGQRGQALVRERFNWETLLPRYRAMYERVVAGAL